MARRARGDEVPEETGTEPGVRSRRPEDTTLWVDQQIRAAMDRGEFDDLPLAGRPLPHELTTTQDPNWWLKGLIERERITGVLPEALQLRKDALELDGELDRFARESDAREAIEAFNRRIIEARRQLAGGPPVVTPTRDVEVALAAWRARRRSRAARTTAVPAETPHRRRWWRKRQS